MKLLVISNMYPDKKHPAYGVFVKKFCEELEKINVQYSKSIMQKSDSVVGKVGLYIKFYVETFVKALFMKYDIVYIHYASHSSAPILAANRFRKITIYTNVHGSDVVPEKSSQISMQKYTIQVLNKSTKIITPSNYFKKYIEDKYQIDASKIFVYPSAGVDRKTFYEKDNMLKYEFNRQYGLDDSLPTFGMAGRISSGKGWDTFILAIAKAEEQNLKANYIIVGNGSEDPQLLDLLKKHHLLQKVKWLPLLSQNELASFYNSIHFLVFPTQRVGESLGLVALEAMACATPVIASDFAAPKDYVVDNENGFKFPVGDANKLADILIKCGEFIHSYEYKNMKQKALETAQQFSSSHVLKQLKSIIYD